MHPSIVSKMPSLSIHSPNIFNVSPSFSVSYFLGKNGI